MKKLLPVIALLVMSFSGLAQAGKDAPYKEITAEELQAMRASDKKLVIIDSQGKEYSDGTIIDGAVPLSAKETTAETLGKIVPSKDASIVFYCTNLQCGASASAAHKAAEAGYTHLYKYPGGIEDWKAKGLPVTKL